MTKILNMNWPNFLTVIRLFLIPFLIGAYFIPFKWGHYLSALIFFTACFTDWLDGYLARVLEQSSPFGAFLDPVADKLLVVVSLVLLVGDPLLPYILLPSLVIIARELIISALREWMAEMGKRASIAVNMLGKVKTTIQMVAITALLFRFEGQLIYITYIGYILLYMAAILTIWSMCIYIKLAWPSLKEQMAS